MSVASWRAYISQHPQFKFQVTTNPLTASFTHPGLNYSSFVDSRGMIDVLNLMSCLLDVRSLVEGYSYKENEQKWFSWDGVNQNYLKFLSSYGLQISRNMYDTKVPKWPLEAKVILGFVGNASVAIQTQLCVSGWQEPLVTKTEQIVSVNNQTRKAAPFPDSFKGKYKDQCSLKGGFRVDSFKRPKTFMYKQEVHHLDMDTDHYDHASYASYVRYAVNGLHLALMHQTSNTSTPQDGLPTERASTRDDDLHGINHPGSVSDTILLPGNISLPADGQCTQRLNEDKILRGITKEIVAQGLKSLKVSYAVESTEGDILDVHIWQEDDEVYVARCSIEKGSQLVCQIILEYFSPLAKL